MYRKSPRFYRQAEASHVDEQKFQVIVEESDLWITLPAVCNLEAARLEVVNILTYLRNVLKLVIMAEPEFQTSLLPIRLSPDTPMIAKKMAKATEQLGVGPFASVAGAVAQEVAGHLAVWLYQQELPVQVIVENGGDLFVYSERERVIGLLADPANGSQLGLLVREDEFPLAICASSATIGHSLSLGRGELAVVRSKSAYLADAAATAYCNMLTNPASLHKALQRAERDSRIGVDGVLLQCRGQIGVWGQMELTPVSLPGDGLGQRTSTPDPDPTPDPDLAEPKQ